MMGVALQGVLLILFVLAAAPAAAQPRLSCEACVVMEDDGRVLFARAPRRTLPNASTTKMVTALVTLDSARLDEMVRVSPRAASTGGGGLDLQAGERYELRSLLYALLLTSSNDAAVALAEHVSGTEARFVQEMNRVADELGADATQFVTAHGLDTPGHVSTARDLATIGIALLEDPVLADIVGTAEATVPGPDGPVVLENRNPLLEAYRGAVGIKTGYTLRAGNVLVAAASRHARTLIAVAMRSEDAAADARELLDHGWRLLRRTVLVEAGERVGTLVFDPSGATAVVAARPITGPQDPTAIRIRFEPYPGVGPPLDPGQRVGTAVVLGPSGGEVARAPAVAADLVEDSGPGLLGRAVGALLRVVHALAAVMGVA